MNERDRQITIEYGLSLAHALSGDGGPFAHRNLQGYDLSRLPDGGEQEIEITFHKPDIHQFRQVVKEVYEPFLKAYPGSENILDRATAITEKGWLHGEAWEQTVTDGKHTLRLMEKPLHELPEPRVDILDTQFVFTERQRYTPGIIPELIGAAQANRVIRQDEGAPLLPSELWVEGEAKGAITPDCQVKLGSGFFAAAEAQGEAFHATLLRHERGHAANGDLSSASPHEYVLERLRAITDAPLAVLSMLTHVPPVVLPGEIGDINYEKTCRALVVKAGGDKGCVDDVFTQLDQALTHITPEIHALAQHIEAYPGFEDMDAADVAADNLKGYPFATYISQKAAQSTFGPELETVKDFRSSLGEVALGRQKEMAVASKEMVRYVRNGYESLVAKHGALLDDLMTLDFCIRDFSHAKELTADLHAAEYAENPESATEFFKRLIEMEKDGPMAWTANIGSRTHPSHQTRIKAIESYAGTIRDARKQNAAKKPDSNER